MRFRSDCSVHISESGAYPGRHLHSSTRERIEGMVIEILEPLGSTASVQAYVDISRHMSPHACFDVSVGIDAGKHVAPYIKSSGRTKNTSSLMHMIESLTRGGLKKVMRDKKHHSAIRHKRVRKSYDTVHDMTIDPRMAPSFLNEEMSHNHQTSIHSAPLGNKALMHGSDHYNHSYVNNAADASSISQNGSKEEAFKPRNIISPKNKAAGTKGPQGSTQGVNMPYMEGDYGINHHRITTLPTLHLDGMNTMSLNDARDLIQQTHNTLLFFNVDSRRPGVLYYEHKMPEGTYLKYREFNLIF